MTVSSHLFWKLRDINVINADNFSGNFLAILSLSLETDFLSTLTFLRNGDIILHFITGNYKL